MPAVSSIIAGIGVAVAAAGAGASAEASRKAASQQKSAEEDQLEREKSAAAAAKEAAKGKELTDVSLRSGEDLADEAISKRSSKNRLRVGRSAGSVGTGLSIG